MPEPPFDLPQAHKFFAIDFNNQTWDIIEAESPTDEQLADLIHLAHASTHHWLQVGNALNRLRALCLLATAYIKVDDPHNALHYAKACVALTESLGDEPTPFDRASAYGCLAKANRLAENADAADAALAKTKEVVESFEHADDKVVIETLYVN